MSAAWSNSRWLVAYWISRAGVALGRYLPTRLCYAVSVPFADLCFLLFTRHRRNLIANLTRVTGEAEAPVAARRVFRNFARYVIDFYQLPKLGRDALKRRIDFDEWSRLDAALNDGAGTLFVTLHLGQAELGGAAISAYGHEFNAVAEPLAHPRMDEFIQGLRRDLGMKVIAANKANSGVLRCLNRGEVLALLFDAVEPGEGILVDFFGAPAAVSSAPARIAIRTGARVLPAVVARDPNDPMRLLPCIDFDLHFEPTGDDERDVQALSQAMACSFERFVRRFADQWFAFRTVWPAQEAAPVDKEAGVEPWKQWSLRLAVTLGRRLPRFAAYGLARLAGDIAFYAREPTRRDVEDNMRHVLGPTASSVAVKRAARDAFRNVARYYVDLVRLPPDRPDEVLAHTRMYGFDRLKALLDSGQGVIVATAHFGNPEMAVQVGAILGLNILVLSEPLRPPSFSKLMLRIRTAFGSRYEDVSFGAMANSIRHLRAGGCLAITCDRNIQDKGVPLPFFGTTTKLPLGAVELAARTGAILMPGYCRRTADGFDLHFEEPVKLVDTGRPKLDALTNARALIERVEPWIRSDPGQWMVLERIWKPLSLPAPIEEASSTADVG